MVRTKEAQISTLVYVVIAACLLFIRIPNETIGIAKGCAWWCRFSYQFFHASWIHLAVNCWALLCLVFYYGCDMKALAAAFVISASVPIGIFPISEGVVTVGVSGVVFALMGMISTKVQRKLYYQGWVLGFIILGIFFKSCNSWLHLYCYALGALLALVNSKRPC